MGFRFDCLGEGTADHPYAVQLQREATVELDRIHDVVMQLVELAEAHGGDYDGWGTHITTGDEVRRRPTRRRRRHRRRDRLARPVDRHAARTDRRDGATWRASFRPRR